jgi:hypothetical protein
MCGLSLLFLVVVLEDKEEQHGYYGSVSSEDEP